MRCTIFHHTLSYDLLCSSVYKLRCSSQTKLARSRSNILVLGHKNTNLARGRRKTLYKYIATSLSSEIKTQSWPEAEAKRLYNPSATTHAAISQSLANQPYCKDARARCQIMRASVSWDLAGTSLTNGSSPLSGCVQTISIRPIRKS